LANAERSEWDQLLGEIDHVPLFGAPFVQDYAMAILDTVYANDNHGGRTWPEVAKVSQNQSARPYLGDAQAFTIGAQVDFDVRGISAASPSSAHG
jgi:hypothetical protein